MLGYALGVIGLSYDDFCRLDFEEFDAICRACHSSRESVYREDWERIRLLAAITIQPHLKKKITPQALIPDTWDKQKPKGKPLTKEEDRMRLERLMKRRKG